MGFPILFGLSPKPKGIRRIRSTWRQVKAHIHRASDNYQNRYLRINRDRKMIRFKKRLKADRVALTNRARSERGSVESALVVIPLLTLFLIAFQIVLTINNRNISASYAQSAAAHRSITGKFADGDSVIDLNSADAFNELRALVTENNKEVPNLIPFLGKKARSTDVHGFSILENQS